MKRKFVLTTLIAVSLVLLVILIPDLMQSKRLHTMENNLTAEHIYQTITASLSKPMIISRTMASDSLLVQALKNEGKESEKAMEEKMSVFLTSVVEQFGFKATFVVSEKTRRYYTPSGIACIVNPLDRPYDIWYQNFLDSGKNVDLDTDLDFVNDYKWTIFVNVRITDTDGTLLGVCGTGIFMEDLTETVAKEEKEHGIKINLIDTDALVQMDCDFSNIENAYIPAALSDMAGSREFTWSENNSSVFRMTRYIPDFEWYLVIQRFAMHGIKTHSASIFLLSVIFVLLVAAILFICSEKEKFRHHDLIKSETSLDPLTSLPNRNYVRNSFGELGIFNTTRYRSIAVLDVDRFKIINESRDGDEILKNVVDASLQFFHEKGLMFRWAGDEFVFFLELNCEEAEKIFTKLCQTIKSTLDISISVGLVPVDLAVSIKTNYHRAARECLDVKSNGGNGVSKCL